MEATRLVAALSTLALSAALLTSTPAQSATGAVKVSGVTATGTQAGDAVRVTASYSLENTQERTTRSRPVHLFLVRSRGGREVVLLGRVFAPGLRPGAVRRASVTRTATGLAAGSYRVRVCYRAVTARTCATTPDAPVVVPRAVTPPEPQVPEGPATPDPTPTPPPAPPTAPPTTPPTTTPVPPTTPPTAPAPPLDIAPRMHDFGAVPLGSSRPHTFTLTNTSNGRVVLTGTVTRTFGIDTTGPSTCFTDYLPKGGSCTVTLRFTPVQVGPATGALTLVDLFTDAAFPVVSLAGTGRP